MSKKDPSKAFELVGELEKINFNEIIRRVEESWNDYNNGHKLTKEDFTSITKQFKRIQLLLKESCK